MKGFARGGDFDYQIVEERSGFIIASISGKNAYNILKNETGGLRFQRVSPTEKNGRIHTSTITIAVFEENGNNNLFQLNLEEFEESAYKGSGKGGQKRNKKMSAVRLVHKPTGISVCVESGRNYHQNRETAWAEMERRLKNIHIQNEQLKEAKNRKNQVGSGMRGDKRRTIAIQRDEVIDHIGGWRISFKKYRNGEW